MQQRFLLQILLLAQHVSGTTMPIIRSSRVLYNGCCLWFFVVDRRYCRLRCPLVCTEVQIINRSERIAKQTVATVCLAMRSLRLIVCTSVHTSGHLNLRYLRSTTKYHMQQPLYNTRAPDDGHSGARNMLSKQ